jgi:hypothetical protein
MDTTKNISIIDIANKLNGKKHIHTNGVYCTVCHQLLTDPMSMEAGKGPVCRDRARFTESLSREELNQVEGNAEGIKSIKYIPHDGIVRVAGEQHPRFANILSRENDEVIFFDRTEENKFYEDENLDYADSVMRSLYIVGRDQLISIAPITAPKSDDYEAKFSSFKDSYREQIKGRDDTVQNFGYESVASKKSLDEDQLENRRNIINNYRADNNSKFKTKWASGEYPIATLMARLDSSKVAGAKDLLAVLQEQYKDIKPKDYGLTDAEITHGLTHSVKNQEKRLFNSLIKGTGDLITISKIYKDLKKTKTPELLKLFIDITG